MCNKGLTYEGALVELNRLNSAERLPVNEHNLKAALAVARAAILKQIKRNPVAEGFDDMDYYLCPQCKNPVGDISDLYEQNKSGRFCRKCGQALDWGD